MSHKLDPNAFEGMPEHIASQARAIAFGADSNADVVPKPVARRRAPTEPWRLDKPTIRVVAGAIDRAADEAIAVLANPEVGVFTRGTALVRPVALQQKTETLSLGTRRGRDGVERPEGSMVIETMSDVALVDILTQNSNWLKFDKRADGWIATDCPPAVAKTVIERRGAGWQDLLPLRAIISAPTLRADTTVLSEPGYDRASGLLLVTQHIWPAVPETHGAAEKALSVLLRPIREMPFASETDRAAALAMMLTAVIRPSLKTSPLFAVTAPTPGSGKSKLVDLAAVLATGRPSAVVPAAKDEEELEKRITAAMLAGDNVISIDNLSFPLRSDFLCVALTQEYVGVRPLGASIKINIQNASMLAATGNNLSIAGDMVRRTVLIRLDPHCERPEDRTFDWDLVEFAKQHRVQLVIAALTVLRAYIVEEGQAVTPALGGFEDWSDVVRSALVWLGQPDPLGNAKELRDADPQRERLAEIMAALPGWSFTAKAIAHEVEPGLTSGRPSDPVMADGLREFFVRGGQQFDLRAFGNFLKKFQGMQVSGRCIEKVPGTKDPVQWLIRQSDH